MEKTTVFIDTETLTEEELMEELREEELGITDDDKFDLYPEHVIKTEEK